MRNWFNRLNIYKVPSSFLSLRVGLALLIADLFLGIFGFMLLEEYGLIDALYMTIITLSTVGFAEVQPLSALGRLFTSILILINMGVFAYVLSVFSYYVIQGELFKKMHFNVVKDSIDKLNGHVILCGYGKYGYETAIHLLQHELPFVIIDQDPNKIDKIQQDNKKLLYLEGDAAQDEILEKAGIKRADALITTLPDDSDNVFVVMTARHLSSKLNIISRARDMRSKDKLTLAGANHVVMPEQIGGFYMSTLVDKPGAVEFFAFMSNEQASGFGFEEIPFECLPSSQQGLSLAELDIRKQTGCNVIGYKSSNGRYEVNPPPGIVLDRGASFIALGNDNQLARLRTYFEGLQKES